MYIFKDTTLYMYSEYTLKLIIDTIHLYATIILLTFLWRVHSFFFASLIGQITQTAHIRTCRHGKVYTIHSWQQNSQQATMFDAVYSMCVKLNGAKKVKTNKIDVWVWTRVENKNNSVWNIKEKKRKKLKYFREPTLQTSERLALEYKIADTVHTFNREMEWNAVQ